LTKLSAAMKQEIEMDGGALSMIYDVDPSISGVPNESLHLARYLKDRILTVDIWNGDSLMHFGTCKIPLYQVLR